MRSSLVTLFGVLFASTSARAESIWTLTTADFHNQSITLRGLDEAGVRGLTPGTGDEKRLPLTEFLQVSRPLPMRPAAAKFMLYISGGDRITGEPITLKDEQIIWSSPTLGELHFPLRQIVAVTRAGATPPELRRKEDVVTLANGDTVRGIVTALADARLTVSTDAGNADVPVGSIAVVSFAATAGAAPASGIATFRVRLDDGGSLAGVSPKLDGDKLALTVAKNAPLSIDLTHVSAIEQVDGPVSWLSSRPPAENLYIPFFGAEQTWAARMDKSVAGGEIRFKDQAFLHGIGVHSHSILSWTLDGTFAAFRTHYAVDGEGPLADVTVRIKLDGRVVYEQADVRAGKLSPAILEDLAGAKKLTLEVDFGTSIDTQGRFNWIEPALLKKMPAPEPPTPVPTTAPALTPATAPSTAPAQ